MVLVAAGRFAGYIYTALHNSGNLSNPLFIYAKRKLFKDPDKNLAGLRIP